MASQFKRTQEHLDKQYGKKKKNRKISCFKKIKLFKPKLRKIFPTGDNDDADANDIYITYYGSGALL